MNIKIKKVIYTIIFITVLLLSMSPKAEAAGLIISFSKSTANIGDTINVTVSGNGVKGKATLSVSGNATLSQNSVNINGSTTVTAKITGSGNVKITATASEMTETSTSQKYTGATAGTIKVSGSTTDNDSKTTSSNANLKNLGIKPNDFSGFDQNKTTYSTTVPENIESVEVYATPVNSNANVTGTGNKSLQIGENEVSVVVTAEDGTSKTYKINITREGSTENTTETSTDEVKKGLSNIRVNDLELTPKFATDTYEYTVQYTGEDKALDIQAIATDPNYNVEIIGNQDLKEGDNIITLLVEDAKGDNIATYQITVKKVLVDENVLQQEDENEQNNENEKMMLIAGGIGVIIVIIVIVVIIKKRRGQAYAEEFSGLPFAGLNEEENEDLDNSQYYINNENKDLFNESKEEKKEETIVNKELEEKEKAKKEFLSGYNIDNKDDENNIFEEPKIKRGKRKGKRFK